jgi:hypothetical protein
MLCVRSTDIAQEARESVYDPSDEEAALDCNVNRGALASRGARRLMLAFSGR